ncbi:MULTISPECIES: TolC family protein [unclassified Janthinobacterium]|uniref:TolC family protein n=1 Tax=unclassified Janthinobacterium TaxID=2610881 RepID=UPI001E2C98FA|nr:MULTISPECIES: TolC family protein [unclassified Janthinobacterium]MCC7641837.1 TolC family protein [Janthinobacterium sp. EB271-G4-3-1]MCC7689963.1 TolC family protein [Janthinobacterium sp. EB271-G4-3-2]
MNARCRAMAAIAIAASLLLARVAAQAGEFEAAPCPSASEAGVPLTLPAAVDLALCHNAQVRGAWAGIRLQAAGVGEARAAFLPTLNAGVSRVHDRTAYPGASTPSGSLNSNTGSLNLSWRLFDFGGRAAGRRSAQALLDAALANRDAVLQKTLAATVSAYFDAQTARANVRMREQYRALANETVLATQRRAQRGLGSHSDTLQAASALAKAALGASRADGEFQKARAVLVYTLGLPAEAGVILDDDGDDAAAGLREGLQDELHAWLARARERHPAIVAAQAQLAAARERVAVSESEGRPSIDLTANIYQNGRPNQGLSPASTRETLVGISLNIPLFDGFARHYKVRGALAQAGQREAEAQDVKQQTLMELVKTHAEASTALANLAASQAWLDAARDAQASVRRKFGLGAADILEMLNTQSALLEAQQERIRCQAEWRSARLRLLASAGVLGREAIAGR